MNRYRLSSTLCGSRISELSQLVASEFADLGPINTQIVEDPVYAGAIGALRIGQDMPLSEWKHM